MSVKNDATAAARIEFQVSEIKFAAHARSLHCIAGARNARAEVDSTRVELVAWAVCEFGFARGAQVHKHTHTNTHLAAQDDYLVLRFRSNCARRLLESSRAAAAATK